MKISIIGLGWFGEPLGEKLLELGHEVLGTTRSDIKKLSLEKKFKTFILTPDNTPHNSLLEAEVIILNIPPFLNQLDWLKSWKIKKETRLIFISSISVETNPLKENAQILWEEEEWIQKNFLRWTILRFGGLIGNGRHPGKYLSGKKNLPAGDRIVRILYLEDAINFTLKVLQEKDERKIFTLLSDENRTRRDFYSDYCRQNNLELPEFSES